MNPQLIGIGLTVLSATGFSTLAIFIKLAYAAGANTLTIMTVRFLLASLLLWIILAWRNVNPRLSSTLTIQLFLAGFIFYGAMSALFCLSLLYLPASLAAMILYTHPVLVTILSVLIGDETFNWRKGLALTTSFAGLSLVLGISFDTVRPLGIVLALGSALFYAIYIVLSNRLLKKVDTLLASTYICSAAATAFTLVCFAAGDFVYQLPPQGWLAMVSIALFATFLAILCFFAGLSRLGASNTSIVSTIEPAITVILSAALLNESIALVQIGGGILILAGIVILQTRSGSNEAQPLPLDHHPE